MSASFFDDSLPLVTLLTMPEPNEALEARALLTLPQRTQDVSVNSRTPRVDVKPFGAVSLLRPMPMH